MITGLMGLGAIGTPIAHKLYRKYQDYFFLIADEARKDKLMNMPIYINDELFSANIHSDQEVPNVTVDFLIVCVKNYSLKSSVKNLIPFISQNTIILPLQNGIFAYDFFKEMFPDNVVLQGYVQGPNTEKTKNGFKYSNPGELHIGSETWPKDAKRVVSYLREAGTPAFFENDIKKMVWKK